jgi:hypothetical protein
MKTMLILVLTGALLGVVVASYVVPPALSWYAEPGGLPGGTGVQSLVQIPDVMKYTTAKLLQGQFIGGIIGAGLGLVLAITMGSRRRKKAASTPVAPPVQR